MDDKEHTPAPWPTDLAPLVRAGESRLLLNGLPPFYDCRLLSEANYQLALRSVNGIASLATEQGADLIARERVRQITAEGYGPTHDDQHNAGEMALAAALYASPVVLYRQVPSLNGFVFRDPWPWPGEDRRYRPTSNVLPDPISYSDEERISFLVKAGALIAAEIDRLKRAAAKTDA